MQFSEVVSTVLLFFTASSQIHIVYIILIVNKSMTDIHLLDQ